MMHNEWPSALKRIQGRILSVSWIEQCSCSSFYQPQGRGAPTYYLAKIFAEKCTKLTEIGPVLNDILDLRGGMGAHP